MADILDPNLYARLEGVEQKVEGFTERLIDVDRGLTEVKVEVHALHEGLTEVKNGLNAVNKQLNDFSEKLGEQRGKFAAVQQWAPTCIVLLLTVGLGTLLNTRVSDLVARLVSLEGAVSNIGKDVSILSGRVAILEAEQGFKLATMPFDPSLHPQISPSKDHPNAVNIVLPKGGPSEVAVKAMGPGEVVARVPAESAQGKFWMIAIKPDVGLITNYGHLAETKVDIGTRVVAGQEIGLVRAGSPVCLQVWLSKPNSSVVIDPRPFFPKQP